MKKVTMYDRIFTIYKYIYTTDLTHMQSGYSIVKENDNSERLILSGISFKKKTATFFFLEKI